MPQAVLQWEFNTGYETQAEPLVSNGVVYVNSAAGGLYAVEAATGHELWHFSPPKLQWEQATAPLLVGDMLYFDGDQELYAVSGRTRRLQWVFETADFVMAAVYFKDTLYVGDLSGWLYALAPDTGTLKWKFATGSRILTAPAVDQDTLYLKSEEAHVYALDQAGQLKWEVAGEGRGDLLDFSAPTAAEGQVFFTDASYLYAVDGPTGVEKWKVPVQLAASHSSSVTPQWSQGLVYAGDDEHLFAVNAADGQKQWTHAGLVNHSPLVLNGRIYYGNSGRLQVAESSSGASLWSYSPEDAHKGEQWFPCTGKPPLDGGSIAISTRPVIVDNVIYYGRRDFCVYAVHLP